MASSLLKNTEKHNRLVAQCNYLLSKLPGDDYILHDMGIRIIIQEHEKEKGDRVSRSKIIRIQGLSTDPIDYWDDRKLEKFYSKLSLILMKIYETKFDRTSVLNAT